MTTLRDVIAGIEVAPEDFAEYQRYVPRFIEEARTGKDWSEWDADVFHKFFEVKDNFLSTFTMYIPGAERQEIKRNWGRFAGLFKELALNQEEPRWDIYQRSMTYSSSTRRNIGFRGRDD
jgi:5-methylcytosine-specific restriction protein B